jgi:hypothetical protein
MTKRELVDEIMRINHSAKPDFLAGFQPKELQAYLKHLQWAQTPRPSGTRATPNQWPVEAVPALSH